jgi:glycosyltransferase involved in cell wall biosynthesis
MKVIMITNNALEDKMGGHERYVRELSSGLVAHGHEVVIVAKRWFDDQPAAETRPDGVVIQRHRVPSKRNPLYAPLYPLYALYGAAVAIRGRMRDSVIHAHMGLQAVGPAARRVPFVLTFHAPVWRELLHERQDTYLLPQQVQSGAVTSLRAAERFVADRASALVVLSEFMRSELAILSRRAAERAIVLPGGVNTNRFCMAGDAPRRDPATPPVLFTARRLTPRTGVDELIRAMRPISDRWPGAKLKIAGVGEQEPELRSLAGDLGLGDSVEFLGRIFDEELVDWYRNASLVVIPTRELEGFGLMTAEALACGAAVVGTPAGATPEILRVVDEALITRDTSAQAIADAVIDILADPARLARIRAAAPKRVNPELGWDAIVDRHLELYESIARG